METPHITRGFDRAISTLRADVLSMAAQARGNLERSVTALLERDIDLANKVIADDDEVDELERKIDALGVDILVRFHPVAGDLRMVISSMKIAMSLERVSDHATGIAKRAKKLGDALEIPEVILIEPLYAMADRLLRDAVSSYIDRNPALGASLHGRDKELDKLHHQTIAVYGRQIEETTGRSQELLHLILTVRSLERVGDLAANIGEDAVFMESARDLRHAHSREL